MPAVMTSCGSWMARRGSSFPAQSDCCRHGCAKTLCHSVSGQKPAKSFLHGFQTAQLQDELDKILFVPGSTVNPSGLRRFFSHCVPLVFGNNSGLIRRAIVKLLTSCSVRSCPSSLLSALWLSIKSLCLPKLTIVRVITQHKPLHGIVGFHLPKTVLLPCAVVQTIGLVYSKVQFSVSGKDFLYYTEDESIITSPPSNARDRLRQ